MPNIFKALGFSVYFWSNEGKPLEPIHVHVAKNASKSGTKFWLYSDGTVHLDSNGSRLSKSEISKLERLLEGHYDEIVLFWKNYFNQEPTFKDML